MVRQYRKLPQEHPCLVPTLFLTSVRPTPSSWKMTLEASPYISLPSAAKFGKCSRSGPHILVRQKELKAFLASAAMSTHSG